MKALLILLMVTVLGCCERDQKKQKSLPCQQQVGIEAHL